MVKILIAALSDLHGVLPLDIKDSDIVCICGDVFPQDIERNLYKSERWFYDVYLPWVKKLPCNFVIMIPGNHCFYLEAVYQKHHKIVIPPEYDSKCICLVDDSFIYRGIHFYGTPWVTNLSRWAFNTDIPECVFDKIPYDCDILLTHHAPNFGKLGCSYPNTAVERNFGSNELTNVLKSHPHIRYHFCGHIHTGTHGGVQIGNTVSYNVSILDEQYKEAFAPTYVELIYDNERG